MSPALLRPLEEAPEGMVKALERASLDGSRHRRHICQGLPAMGQGLRLIEVGECLAGLPIAVDAFLKRRVVELALCVEHGVQPPPDAALLGQQTKGDLSIGDRRRHAGTPVLRIRIYDTKSG